jgi:hypothetical protein
MHFYRSPFRLKSLPTIMRARDSSTDAPDPVAYGEDARARIHLPVAGNSAETFIFARRKPKDRGAKPKFYFFTSDEDTLVVAATAKKVKSRLLFKISASSKDIKKKSPCYLGLCSEGTVKKTYTGYKVLPARPTQFITTVKIITDVEPEQVLLPPPGKSEFAFPDSPDVPLPSDVVTLSCVHDKDTTLLADPSYEQMRLLTKDTQVMFMKQSAVDEFEIEVRNPLSPYQAFCIACVLTWH